MLSVIVIWFYMFLTTFLVGYGMLQAFTRFIPYRIRHGDAYLVCGLVGVTVYAQFYSLSGGVGLGANALLCVVCGLIAWCVRKPLGDMLGETWRAVKENRGWKRGKMFGMLFLFLLFAYGTSRGIIHYDTGLYHAQSIRWIEEYGVVKGLGNLHCRLAYNSASFVLSALYGMAFSGGQSYHCCAGFLALLVAKVCLEAAGSFRTGRLRTSDFARVMGIYYLVIIFDEMVSPASDYFMVLTVLYLVIRWLELLENHVRQVFPYAMLCVLGVFLMTVKLSAALILLLTVYPAYWLIRGRRWRETAVYVTAGFVTALPFFIRNVLLSGWLVYPFTQIDFFNVVWKIPKGMADYDAHEIQVWGRGYTDVARYDISVTEWLPDWFRALAGSDKLFVAAAAVAVCVLLVFGVGMLCGLWEKRWDMLTVQITVAASFLFWLFTSPLIRYGCVYVYLTPAVVLGGVYDAALCGTWGRKKADTFVLKALRFCGWSAALVLVLYKGAALCREIADSYVNDYWIVQKDYENFETLSYEMNEVVFYYPAEGDRVGYEAFPSAPVKTRVEFLGQGIEDGFTAASD